MKVSELLDAPEKWTQGTWARADDGHSTLLDGALAVSWCLHGAIMRCYPLADGHAIALRRIGERLEWKVAQWNDDPARTFDEVRALVRELDI